MALHVIGSFALKLELTASVTFFRSVILCIHTVLVWIVLLFIWPLLWNSFVACRYCLPWERSTGTEWFGGCGHCNDRGEWTWHWRVQPIGWREWKDGVAETVEGRGSACGGLHRKRMRMTTSPFVLIHMYICSVATKATAIPSYI